MLSSKNVKMSAYAMGFDLVSVSSAEPLEEDRKRYVEWKEKGYAGDLKYMVREAPRRWAPQDLLPGAKSVVTFAVNFFSGAKRVGPKRGFGRVARYDWGKHYNLVIKERLQAWAKTLAGILGGPVNSNILVDSGPLLERAFAGSSGMGFVGKNTLLISRKLGSFLFLSEVLTDVEIEPDRVTDGKSGDACGPCTECIADCPTGALVAPRQLDARKCISYWTIENRGGIPEEMRPQIGDWIFGCDICQEVCPYNGIPRETRWKDFLPEAGAGPYLSLVEVLRLKSEDDFKKRFQGTPVLRAKRSGLVRNACVVAANQKLEEAVPSLRELSQSDPDPVVASHASWALKQI